jgi:3-methylfumaryl-CoA hydratase
VSDRESWRRWIGREYVVEDVMDPARAQALHATLDRPGDPPVAGDPLPPLWHWIYFWAIASSQSLGGDGHLAMGRFLPPIDLPRRMWAGSRFTFHRDLTLGAPAERRSVLADVALKQGRSGPLAFVTVRHSVSDRTGVCFEEEQDVVFRGAEPPRQDRPPPQSAPTDGPNDGPADGPTDASTDASTDPPIDAPAWVRRATADPVLLFRYSALTFNGHRIHYDPDYARGAEGYSGLVVHGPLLGLLMCQMALDETRSRQAADYRFRLSRPIFAQREFTIAGSPSPDGREARLWVRDDSGALAAEGRLVFA